MTFLAKNLDHLAGLQTTRKQELLADVAEISQGTVSKILQGRYATSYLNVLAWAEHFRVSIDDLVRRDIASDGVSQPSAGQFDEALFLRCANEVERHVQRLPTDFGSGSVYGAILAVYRERLDGGSADAGTIAGEYAHAHDGGIIHAQSNQNGKGRIGSGAAIPGKAGKGNRRQVP